MPEPRSSASQKLLNIPTDSLVVLSLLCFSLASWFLQGTICTSCVVPGSGCPNQQKLDCIFFFSYSKLSFLLILTHAIPYVLIPLTMRIMDIRMDFLMNKTEKRMNPFALQLGLACICVALAFEFGWHVSTTWYYRNDFNILNFVFYFFLISSFALWADGFYSHAVVDIVFAALLAISAFCYVLGALNDVAVPPPELTYENSDLKIPLYIALTVTFAMMTWRGMKILDDKRMLWVPFFSVVVNLYFAFKLQNLDTGLLPRSKWNYIYHIAHDLLGTELGVAIFAYLVWDNPRHREEKAKKQT